VTQSYGLVRPCGTMRDCTARHCAQACCLASCSHLRFCRRACRTSCVAHRISDNCNMQMCYKRQDQTIVQIPASISPRSKESCDTIPRPPNTHTQNMGMCLVSRKWYVDACLGHLSEPRNFCEVAPSTVPSLLDQVKHSLTDLLGQFRAWSKVPGRSGRFAAHLKYLSCKSNDPNISVPVFYGLIKVHKTPTALRPIVACHSWLTTPISVRA
jgi:hypothetical protein